MRRLTYQIEFPNWKVLQFNYRAVQLNRLNWRDFLKQRNPLASALMAKMKIAPQERPQVKAECLRLLVTLKLDPARMQLISGFVDTYLRLTESEVQLTLSRLRCAKNGRFWHRVSPKPNPDGRSQNASIKFAQI